VTEPAHDAALRLEVRGPIELTVQLRQSEVTESGEAGADDPVDGFVTRLGGAAGASRQRFEVVLDGWRFEVSAEPARHAELRERSRRSAAERQPAARTVLRSQIPGRVTRLWVAQGDQVVAGQRLLAVEAMKMENELRAPRAGQVEAVHVEAGSRVERDDPLLTLS
jgi:biotin carboxyl carrier protein